MFSFFKHNRCKPRANFDLKMGCWLPKLRETSKGHILTNGVCNVYTISLLLFTSIIVVVSFLLFHLSPQNFFLSNITLTLSSLSCVMSVKLHQHSVCIMKNLKKKQRKSRYRTFSTRSGRIRGRSVREEERQVIARKFESINY